MFVLFCVQELIMRDSGSGWSLGPELDHFSSRTRHLLQYMNPNKINMDLILDILEYLGNITHTPYFKHRVSNHMCLIMIHSVLLAVSFLKENYLLMVLMSKWSISVFSSDKSPQFRDVDGAVLIFLPGLAHIQQLHDLLTYDKRFSSKDR